MAQENNNLPELPHTPSFEQQLNDALQRLAAQENELRILRQHGGESRASPTNLEANNRVFHVNMTDECMKGRVPDLIKGIPTFSGKNPKQVGEWIQCVERILNQYNHLRGSELYVLWLQEVRNKIIESASDKLASQGTPLDWDAIKNQLKFLYGDKREMSTLLQKLFVLHQGGNDIDEYMAEIQDVFTGISSLIQVDQEWVNKHELIRFIDKMCLEKFIDGLQEPFSSHVGIQQPKSLDQAYKYAVEKANKLARRSGRYDLTKPYKQPVSHQKYTHQLPIRTATQFGPMNYRLVPNNAQNFNSYVNQYRPPYQMHQNNQQRFQQFPQPSAHQNSQQNPQQKPQYNTSQNNNSARLSFRNQQSLQNRSAFQKPEPMSVDPSTQSRLVNYINRPMYQIEEIDPNLMIYPESYTDLHMQEPETMEVPQDEHEDNKEDDLNFQMAIDQNQVR